MTSFTEACKLFFTRGFDFNGRSSRAEYWWAYLMLVIGYIACLAVLPALGEIGVFVILILVLVILIPSISIGIRRLHDIDRSGWWYLITIVPLISLVLLFFFCTRGTVGPNRYGEDPYGEGTADVFT